MTPKRSLIVVLRVYIKGILGKREREREGKEKWGKKPGRAKIILTRDPTTLTIFTLGVQHREASDLNNTLDDVL